MVSPWDRALARAGVAASWREGRLWDRSSAATRLFVFSRCIIKRWMDDLYIFKPAQLPPWVADYFKELTSELFYGEKLVLERKKKVDPFGFVASIDATGLTLRPKLTFRIGLDETLFQRKWPILQGPHSFQSDGQLRGVIYGQGLRILDTTASTDEACLTSSLNSLLLELKWVDCPDDWIADTARKISEACNRPVTLSLDTKDLNSSNRMDICYRRALADSVAEIAVLNQTLHDRLVLC